MTRSVEDRERPFLQRQICRFVIRPEFERLYDLLSFFNGFIGVVAQAKLGQHIGEPHEVRADAPPLFCRRFLLRQGVTAPVPCKHVIQEPHGQARCPFERGEIEGRVGGKGVLDESGKIEAA